MKKLATLVVAALLSHAAATEEPADDVPRVDLQEAEIAAFALNATGAATLSAKLEADPADHLARATLLSYEQSRVYENGGDRDAAARGHTLAGPFVRDHPGSPASGSLRPVPAFDPAGYVELAAFWEPHLAAERPPLPVLLNAGKFFRQADGRRSHELFTRAVALYPDDAGARKALAQSWSLRSLFGQPAGRVAGAEEALTHYLAAERIGGGKDGRDEFLDGFIAEAARVAGDTEIAGEYARRMVDAPGGAPGDEGSRGSRVYDGNRILGHLALNAGDVPAAVAFLDAAGESEGSPVLNSFGPELTLAQALLEVGETEAVLRHLDAVGRFWRKHDEKLEAWSAAIRAGVPVKLNRFGG